MLNFSIRRTHTSYCDFTRVPVLLPKLSGAHCENVNGLTSKSSSSKAHLRIHKLISGGRKEAKRQSGVGQATSVGNPLNGVFACLLVPPASLRGGVLVLSN